MRPLLRWIARSNTPEIFYRGCLAAGGGHCSADAVVGLSMALGAFLAGVLLAESEYRRELETDIEPFKGLLLGLFFIAVGMSIDFGVLLQSPVVVALIVLAFLAIKGAVIFGLSRVMGLPFQERPVFTLLLAPRRRICVCGVPNGCRRQRVSGANRIAADWRPWRCPCWSVRCC